MTLPKLDQSALLWLFFVVLLKSEDEVVHASFPLSDPLSS